MGQRCTRCEPVVYSTMLVKYKGEPERFPLLWYPQCESTDTTEENDGKFTYHHCQKHRLDVVSPATSIAVAIKAGE